MQSVSTFFKVEKDVFYKLGERKGVEKGIMKVAANLKQQGIPADEIAKATGLTVEQIAGL